MKRLLLAVAFLLLTCVSGFSQTPSSIPYQAVARNASGNLLSNQSVGLRFTVHQSTATGGTQYQETQTATTNKLGLFNVNMGAGTVVSGTFGGITWSDGQPKFLQVEIDPAGGTIYTDMGAAQMMSVPYALFAGRASAVTSSNLTESTSNVLSITGGSNSVVSASGTTIQVKKATASQDGYLAAADWTTFNNKQNAITLSTSGSSGAATFVSNTLNIPNYTLAGLGGIGLSALSASSPLSYNNGTGAFSISQASTSVNGYLSSTDWNTFNSKQAALTFTAPLANSSNTVTVGYDNSTIKMNGSNQLYAVNTGTVTSIGVTVPTIMSISPASITSSGTFAFSLATQAPNAVFAGPASGSTNAAPTFRGLVAADLPSGNGSYIQNQISSAQSASFEINGIGEFTAVSSGTGVNGDLQLGCTGSNCWTVNNPNGIIGFVGYGKAHGEMAFYPDYTAFALLSSSCCTPSGNMGALSTALAFDNLWAGSGYFMGNSGIGTATPSGLLELKKTTQLQANLVLSGQEYYQSGNSSTGIALMAGVNRSGNKQLWIADEDNVATQSSSNSAIRIMPNGTTPVIDAVTTTGTTSMNMQVGTANVGIGGTPSQRLDVYGNLGIRGDLVFENTPTLCPASSNNSAYTITSADITNGVWYAQNNNWPNNLVLPGSSAGQVQGQIIVIYSAASSAISVSFPNVNNGGTGSVSVGSGQGMMFMWTTKGASSGWFPIL